MERRSFLNQLLPKPVVSSNTVTGLESHDLSPFGIDRRSFFKQALAGALTIRRVVVFTAVALQAACSKSCSADSVEYSFLGDNLEKGFASREEVQLKSDELKKLYDPIASALPVIASFLDQYRTKGPILFDERSATPQLEGSDWSDGTTTFKDHLRHSVDRIVTAFSFYENKKEAFPQRTLDLLWEAQKLGSEFTKSLTPEPQNTPDSRKGEGFERQWLKNDGNGHELLVNLEADLELIAANLEYDLKLLENVKEDKDDNDKPRWYPNGDNVVFKDPEAFSSSIRLDKKENWEKGFSGEGSFYDAYTASSQTSSSTTRGLYRLGSHK